MSTETGAKQTVESKSPLRGGEAVEQIVVVHVNGGCGKDLCFFIDILSSLKLTYPYITAASVDKRQRLTLKYSGATYFGSSLVCRSDRSSLIKRKPKQQLKEH